MSDTTTRTELSALGEFGLIDRLASRVQLTQPSSVKGIGDDAAVIDPSGLHQVVTTDMLVEGVHFDLAYMPLKHLGYKAIVVNLSDVYAMNAEPRQVTVALALSNRFPVEAVDELYEGMLMACRQYGVDLVGGDTSSSRSGLVIAVTAIGAALPEELVYRSGAGEHDLLVVSGDLGGAYMGLQVLEREKAVFTETGAQPDLAGHDYILERQLKPEARKDIVALLKQLGVKPTAMIDISDGLASEALHIARSSGVGVRIYDEKLPIDPATYNTARDFNLDPTLCALSGGEDYELLFTIRQADFEAIKGNPNLTVVGHMTDATSGYRLVDKQGGEHELTAQGWDAFLKKD
ncbi:MAG: thiamine-phosphate kinase [Flavobacteriales bacterium]|nr:thiamine-phosphate kinase [Flavobacteriales bacterium]MBK7942843.1 thiamine-phosphate kinase [Flavobacteriales bacterium]MBK9698755.1 thiamine-phosphate kinase [Flavobacteriales bacterium]